MVCKGERDMMTDMNMKEFLNVLSSKEPVPGGGLVVIMSVKVRYV